MYYKTINYAQGVSETRLAGTMGGFFEPAWNFFSSDAFNHGYSLVMVT